MIENEVKIVLDLEAANHIHAYPEFLLPFIRKSITQGYHRDGGRVRCEKVNHAPSHYTFNYKIDLPDGQIEEFEMDIDRAAFDRCYPLSKQTVEKFRYTYVDDDNEDIVWDVDFFTEQDEVYFVMAECEMPEGMEKPPSLPEFIRKYKIHCVARDDNRFTSKKLGTPAHARLLLAEIETNRKLREQW